MSTMPTPDAAYVYALMQRDRTYMYWRSIVLERATEDCLTLKVPSDGSRAIVHLPISLYYHVPEEVRQAPAHAPCGPSFNCMFDIPRLLYVLRDTLCICK